MNARHKNHSVTALMLMEIAKRGPEFIGPFARTIPGWICLLAMQLAWSQPPSTNPSDATATFVTPSAPILSADESLRTIQLVDGYELKLVASEPMIQDPIAISFDPDGRIWVCEMRGFMPNIDGIGEDEPVGVISVLEDTDHDGVMDQRKVFVDGLVLPRGVCWTLNGVLVCENGTIWLCRDVDGDDRCDEKEVVCTYTPGNLEHSLNGLMPALDNCIYNAKEGIRLQWIDGKWVPDRIEGRGQWGMTQDNVGRLRYNVNASLIRGDLLPCYSPAARTDNALVDVQLYDDQTMYPIRPTPGINRGYLPGFLRPDGSLVEANSNCGPVVFRGDNLPPDLVDDVFIPDPAGNLIRRQELVWQDGRLTSNNAYDRREFLASTDERFRPVNMFNAPDGTLYIVDMYRGVIQHAAFITPYLREQIERRDLASGIHLGRIYRVVHRSTRSRHRISLSHLNHRELVELLAHPNGWHRDMSQQLLVQRGDRTIVPALEELVTEHTNALARLHGLWTLEGLGRLDPELLYECLQDPDANVRASAITMSRRFLSNEALADLVSEDLLSITDDPSPIVQVELVQALGRVDSLDAADATDSLLRRNATKEAWLDGMIAGFTGTESEFIAARTSRSSWDQQETWREVVLKTAAGVMWRRRDPIAVLRFCEVLDSIPDDRQWQMVALLEGIKDPPIVQRRRFEPVPGTGPRTNANPTRSTQADNRPSANESSSSTPRVTTRSRRRVTLRLESVPAALDRLRSSPNGRLAEAADSFADKLIWPGKDGQPLPVKPALNSRDQRAYDLGRDIYQNLCAGCHHPTGWGLAAKGPPLLGSEWLEDESKLIRVVLHGIEGPILIGGETYNVDNRLSMPGMHATLSDDQIAGVLTYVRREFTDDSPPVETSKVRQVRDAISRSHPWTEAELETTPGN